MAKNRNTIWESMLFFGDANQSGADDAGVYKASEFICMQIASATTISLKFRGGADRDSIDSATATVPTLAAGAGTYNFKNACKAVSAMLNGSKGQLSVVADEKNKVFMEPFIYGGAGSVVVANA